ncbi:hypothetical protein CXB51_015144 [Gossypium anomalum]|uniref:Reverse transcriptase domain-containing protein n=1 Tax=Gossypium anomalum TaxID=47600 RepID=A0A8J6D320_9ROSI|nr:hypothetical protein CXB51_015144 [Gossypium anomalum]
MDGGSVLRGIFILNVIGKWKNRLNEKVWRKKLAESKIASSKKFIAGYQWVCQPTAMKMLCWNVRGLGSSRAVHRLQHMLKIYHPQFVFFMETKLSASRMENVRRRCGFLNGVEVAAKGSKGGLSVGWNDVREKARTWELLRTLGRDNTLPWLVGGDFNDILFSNEKQGGILTKEARMEAFRQPLESCQLWTVEDSCEAEVKKLWESSLGSFPTRMLALAKGLQKWARLIKPKRGRHVKRLTSRLEVLNGSERSEESLADLVDVKIQLNLEMDKEERYWEQRARVNWLKMGDRNTLFFHKMASQRRHTNRIQGLQREDGFMASNSTEFRNIARDYFVKLFESHGTGNMNHILLGVPCSISESMNQSLLVPYTEKEVVEALKGIGPTKASGSDGFPSMEKNNRTQIVLIPNIANPTNLKNFRPISLCTVLYKIISKTVANRLQKVLDGCIEDSQSAFVPGRLITDNVLLAYEVLHYFKNKRSGRKGLMALKFDMSKAYDRVEWPFIKGMMPKLGFANSFIDFIIKCISSVQYSILLNGEEGQKFNPSRGLRQGALLSLYLFLFCGEGLSALMRLARQKRKILGAKVCISTPPITHLMFADDCILFGEVTDRGIQVIKDILREYESCSGQCVNFNKSTAFFSSNVVDHNKNLVLQSLNVRCSTEVERYLGLPNMVGRRKKMAFQSLKKSYEKRGIHWCNWKSLCDPKEEGGMGLGNLLSLTWQSIWAAKGLLLSGMRWRIGDGTNVSIWGDPGSSEYRVQNLNVNSNLLLVADLIDDNTRKWKTELILDTFSVSDAERILCIPLSMNKQADHIIWRRESTGEYTVRSGHKMFLQERQNNTHSNYRHFYKRIWSLDLPPKIKITNWRLFHNFLPTFCNLHYRRLMRSAICRRCNNGSETREHVFKECPVAQETWSMLGFNWPSQEANSDFSDWLNNIFELFSFNQCRTIACALWVLWNPRNRFIHEGELKWDAPTDPWVKINFDAAFKKELKESCSGIVARNARSEVIFAKTVFHKNIPSAFAIEAMACLQAIRVGLLQGLRKVVVEGDSRTVIRKLQEKVEDRSEIEVFIQDSKFLSSGFESCVFRFINREANKVAHLIAKGGLQKKETTYLQNAFTSEVEEALIDDRWREESMRD